jgi:hypothetical protein
VIWPPVGDGFGVVASVVAGPSGTRIGEVSTNDDGSTTIALAGPARAAVTVAWFVVPAVDEVPRSGRPERK